ncbi:hypothetical protein LV457_09795 [Mycobacterium sp. MYCO198283]|uniref:hypothetical protein n=1 Tax=Mycobacterium sp. MYCO198283 TaxID=2883505 RepID=UPI001E4D11AE|nr:hypothetical protein [Mycobacterium sp. MYCO198283]MCG5432578.1 hypothetical protein [Mycobacterium sp. MYCO198283]
MARALRSTAGMCALVAMASGCGDEASPPPPTTATTSTHAPAAPSPPLPAPTAQATPWIYLDVGDCLRDPPPTDPTVLTVDTVDCTTPHAAEVYLRADIDVNAAIAEVADQRCAAGLRDYAGDAAPLAFSYLIDSEQNRTSSNPAPSAVICLLQRTDGGPLIGTARR